MEKPRGNIKIKVLFQLHTEGEKISDTLQARGGKVRKSMLSHHSHVSS